MTKSFSTLRSFLWPIHAHELGKFLPLFLMAFFVGFNYNILRTMKDTLLVTADHSGAEVIPFIKVWGVVPGAFLMTFIYSRLNNKLPRNLVFYSMIGIFLVFFALFTFVIYPLRDVIQPHETANYLQSHLPLGFKGLIAMFRYWTFSSYYIMSELWAATVLSMLFWGFANEITPLDEAKRFYVLISIAFNIAAIAAGQISAYLSGCYSHSLIALKENAWEQSLDLLTCTVIVSGFVIIALYWYLNRGAERERIRIKKEKPPKIKMSMRENFATLFRSKYLLNLTIIVLAYNIAIALIEVIWKDQVKQNFPDPNAFNGYMSQVTTWTGVIALLTSILVSGQMIRKLGWTKTAIVTPILFIATSIVFFLCFFGRNYTNFLGIVTLLGTSPAILVVLFGGLQDCLCRGAKFTFFDATKEMAFIPLSPESRLKGKAVIDGIGSRIGKSGGSFIHQVLLILFSTISAGAPIVALIIFAVIGFWLGSVLVLGKEFNLLTKSQATPATDLPTPSVAKEEEKVLV